MTVSHQPTTQPPLHPIRSLCGVDPHARWACTTLPDWKSKERSYWTVFILSCTERGMARCEASTEHGPRLQARSAESLLYML